MRLTPAPRKNPASQAGEFAINGLAPGKYTVRVVAPKFALYEQPEVEVTAGGKAELTIALTVEAVKENVDVNGDGQIDTDPNNSAGATVLKDKDLDALPDDPDELEAALQALAGPSSGPNGGQIYIDGFTGGISTERNDPGNPHQPESVFGRIRPVRFRTDRNFDQTRFRPFSRAGLFQFQR